MKSFLITLLMFLLFPLWIPFVLIYMIGTAGRALYKDLLGG